MSCALCGTIIKNRGSIKMQRSLIHEDQGSKCGKVAMTGIKLKYKKVEIFNVVFVVWR